MGCITSVPREKISDSNSIKLHTKMMLDRDTSLSQQLSNIIDEDKYKHTQNTLEKSEYVELSHSVSQSTSSGARSRELSDSYSLPKNVIKIKSGNGGIMMMGFASSENVKFGQNKKEIEESESSEPSLLIGQDRITLMGFAD